MAGTTRGDGLINRTVRRLGSAGAPGAALLLVGSGAAMAHECFNASSSNTGNEAKGTHSQSWAYVPSIFIIDDVLNGEEGIGGTPEQQACFTEGALAAMGESVAIGVGPAKGTDEVVALRSPNTADGKGIDHLFPVLVGVAEGCGYVLDF